MLAIPKTGEVAQERKLRWLSCTCYLLTAALLVPAAWLQHAASLQRWVTLVESGPKDSGFAEDHLYDYVFPAEPWVNIGTVTEQYSLAALLLMFGMVSLTLGVLLQTKGAPRLRILIESSLSVLVVAGFGVNSLHVFLSGATGTPGVLQHWQSLGLLASLAGIALARLWWGRAPVAALGCYLVMGSTTLGYVVAYMFFAPMFAGYISYDTTPWMESVVAAFTGAAALVLLVAAFMVVRKVPA